MDWNLLTLFVALNIANVIIQTVKSLATVKCGKTVAALVNAIAYGLYTYVIIFTVCDLPTPLKAGIVAIANLIGVYVVKAIEEKIQKTKLWLVKMTVPSKLAEQAEAMLEGVPNSLIDLRDDFTVFDCYCSTKDETQRVKDVCRACGGKMFATEDVLVD